MTRTYQSLLIVLLILSPMLSIAQEDFVVNTPNGQFDVVVTSTHVELEDSNGDIILLSHDGDTLSMDALSSTGMLTLQQFDMNTVNVTSESESALTQLMNAIDVEPYDGGGGGPGNVIVQGALPDISMTSRDVLDGSYGTQSVGCFGATLGLAAAGAAVYLACGGPQAVLACSAALANYVNASISYWTACGFLEES